MSNSTFRSISLSGGSGFTGMNLCLTFQALQDHPIKFSLKNDTDRQTVLLLILAIQAISSMIAYPGVLPMIGQNLLSIPLFGCIQFGLVIINHNTIFRLRVAFPDMKIYRTILKYYRFFYLIPLFTLIPIYFAVWTIDPFIMAINQSPYNIQYYKPLNIVLVIITETLAVYTDMKLLIRVGDVTFKDFTNEESNNSSNDTKSSSISIKKDWKKVRRYNHKDLWFDYILIWIILSLDIILKFLITFGIPLLFDSAVSCLTMVLRARLNLRYDSLLRHMLEYPKIPDLTSVIENNRSMKLHAPHNTFKDDSIGVSQQVADFMNDFVVSEDLTVEKTY